MFCSKKKKEGADEDDAGMRGNDRKCTDGACGIFFIFFWIGMIVVASIGLSEGTPERLIYGTDYNGRICGSGDLKEEKLIVYPRLAEDFLYNSQQNDPRDYKFYGVCVTECPQLTDLSGNLTAPAPDSHSIVCNGEVPIKGNYLDVASCMFGSNSGNTCSIGGESFEKEDVLNNCWSLPYQHSSVFHRCIPKVNQTAAVSTCAYPADVTDATDARCMVVREAGGELYKPPGGATGKLFSKLATVQALWGRYFGDIQNAVWVILGSSVGGGVFFGFLFLLLMRACLPIVVWALVALSIVVTSAGAFFSLFKAGILDADVLEQDGFSSSRLSESSSNKKMYKVAAFVLLFIAVALLCVAVAMRKSISRAISIMRLAARAVGTMPLIIILPFALAAVLLGLVLYAVFVGAAVYSTGDTPQSNMTSSIDVGDFNVAGESELFQHMANSSSGDIKSFVPRPGTKVMLAYHFFGVLWMNAFLDGLGAISVAGAVCAWYFSLDDKRETPSNKDKRKKLLGAWLKENKGKTEEEAPRELLHPPAQFAGHKLKLFRRWGGEGNKEVWHAIVRSMRYHLGSVAMGSFLIAIVQAVRAALTYIQKQMEKTGWGNRKWFKFVCCCVNCLIYCLEQCIKFVSSNAYVYIALKGTSFMPSAKRVVGMLVSNPAIMTFVTAFTGGVIFLGKIAIAGCCCFITFLALRMDTFQEGGEREVSSSWLPALMTLLFSYVIGSIFLGVLDTATDAVLISYIVDLSENKSINGHSEPGHTGSFTLLNRLQHAKAAPKAATAPPAGGAAAAGGGAAPEGKTSDFTNPLVYNQTEKGVAEW